MRDEQDSRQVWSAAPLLAIKTAPFVTGEILHVDGGQSRDTDREDTVLQRHPTALLRTERR
jgi:hypothetical protein